VSCQIVPAQVFESYLRLYASLFNGIPELVVSGIFDRITGGKKLIDYSRVIASQSYMFGV